MGAAAVWTLPAFGQVPAEDVAAALVAAGAAPAATAGRVTAEEMDMAVAGLRFLGGGDALALNDAWYLGSNTKALTALLAARLIKEGWITWDATVGNVLGPSVTEFREDWRDTTLRALLTHRSGTAANLSPASSSDLGQGGVLNMLRTLDFCAGCIFVLQRRIGRGWSDAGGGCGRGLGRPEGSIGGACDQRSDLCSADVDAGFGAALPPYQTARACDDGGCAKVG